MTYRLAEQFVIRVPALPFAVLPALAHPEVDAVRTAMRALVEQPGVIEALYVAAPGLLPQLTAWRAGAADPALERTLLRYLARMAGRATPFGLFSGVAVGGFGPATKLELAAIDQHERHTRLDNDYLSKLCDALLADPATRKELVFVTNSSLYRVDTFWRYAEGRMANDVRSYNLLAASATPYLDQVLERATTGATLAELGDVLDGDPELDRETIDGFIDELVNAQLIVPTLQPTVTGREPVYAMIDALGDKPAGRVLAAVTRDLEALDAAHGEPPETYRATAAKLEELGVKVDPQRLFQVDLHVALPGLAFGPRLASELKKAFDLVCKLAVPRPREDAWSRFRDQFSTRYETREVPLVEALDEESGIGFGSAPMDTAQAPLLVDLAFPGRAEPGQVFWTERERRLLSLVDGAVARGALEIELTADDLKVIGSDSLELPDTTCMMITVMANSAEAIDRGELLLRASHLNPASATRLLGRFCHGSPGITELVRGLTAHEQAAAPDVIFAEIVHLPEGRIGNILLRPVLREYEIPYLGTSGADRDHQIPVTDLMVSVQGDRVVLRSKRLGKEVRPQMATAHNYPMRSLAIYRFLCAHSTQHTNGAGWSWGALDDAPFLPRVRSGKVILSRARWTLSRSELAPLKTNAAALALRDKRRLPRWIAVAQGDNEFVIDFDNPISVESFTGLVHNLGSAEIFELLPAPDQLAVHGAGGAHHHEIVVPFVRELDDIKPTAVAKPSTIQRRFAPGSNWLYAKLYAGTATADALLRELAPFIREILDEKLADRFFFIRYGDPDHHLRLRFRGDPAALAATVLPRLHAAVEPAIERNSVWKLQLDTYEREVERYGGDQAIELSEDLFAADSEAVLTIVESTPGDEGAQARWKLAVRGLDQLMTDLGMSAADKLATMTRVRDGFGQEHGMNAGLQRQLGDKFRTHRGAIESILAATPDSDHELAPGVAAFAQRSEKLIPIGEKLRAIDIAIPRLVESYAHMHVNRMLPSMQRRQEFVIYDLLRRHYDGVRARAKKA